MIVHESSDTRRDRARLWNLMLGGKEGYEQDRDLLQWLRGAAPDVNRLAVNEAEFVARGWRFAVGMRNIDQVIYCGAPLTPNDPPHFAAWEPIALGQLRRVVYVEPDRVLCAKGASYLADKVATVLLADPLDPPAMAGRIDGEIEWDRPVAVVAPGVLHWLDAAAAREWTLELSGLLATGSYLIASHFLDPETDSTVVLIERLIQAMDHLGHLGRAAFRSKDAIAQLVGGWDLVQPGVIPAQGWYPTGPQLRAETPCDRLMAGVVATIRRGSP